MKRIIAFLLALSLCLPLCACGESEAVVSAKELIASIGEVTDQSGELIQQAENAVAALTDKERESIDSISQLTEARARYEEILVLKPVEDLIADIGTVTVDSGDAITAAREAYDALDDAYKEKVANYSTLQTAEQTISSKRVEEIMGLISAIELEKITASAADQEQLQGIYVKYNALSEEERDLVSNFDKLENAKDKYNEIYVHALVTVKDISLSQYTRTNELVVNIEFENNYSSTIKYIGFVAGIKNSVGDYLKVQNSDLVKYKFTGPYKPHEGDKDSFDTGVSYSADKVGGVELVKIEIEYMDGSKREIDRDSVRFAFG